MNREEALGAYIDLLLSTPEEKHITGELEITDVDPETGLLVMIGWCAVGLAYCLDWTQIEGAWTRDHGELTYADAYDIVNWLLDAGPDCLVTERIVNDNDDGLLTFREIAEHLKNGDYAPDIT